MTRTLTGKAAVEAMKRMIQDRNREFAELREAAMAVTVAISRKDLAATIAGLKEVLDGKRCGAPFDGVRCDQPKGHEHGCSWTRPDIRAARATRV